MRDMVSLDFGELSGQGELFSKLKWKGGRFGESKKNSTKNEQGGNLCTYCERFDQFHEGDGWGELTEKLTKQITLT